MDLILQKLGGIEGGLASVREDVRSLQGDMQTLKGDVKTLKEDVQTLKEDVQTLKDRVTNIEITLENETNRNIQLIAEGHLNLARKLDEALKELQPNIMYQFKSESPGWRGHQDEAYVEYGNKTDTGMECRSSVFTVQIS